MDRTDSPIARLAARLRTAATGRTLALSGATFVVAATLLFATSAPFSLPTVEAACGQAAPDVRFYTSADGLDDFLADCGTEGRAAYRNLQLADLVYPLVAGVFPALALALVLDRIRQQGSGGRDLAVLAVLPLVGAALDYAENAVAWIALAAHPDRSPAAPLFGLASAGKQLVNWASWVLLLAALSILAWRRFASRRRNTSVVTP